MGTDHLGMPHLAFTNGDNQGPSSNSKGELTQLPFWRTAKRRRWGFRVLTVDEGRTGRDK